MVAAGGIYCDEVSLVIRNCVITANNAGDYGGGMGNLTSDPTITNCILWGNSAYEGDEIHNSVSSNPAVTYSCIQDDNPDDEEQTAYDIEANAADATSEDWANPGSNSSN